MDAIALIFAKFSEELIGLQLALLFFASTVAAYWLLIKKKKKESAEWVPAALVRAYLDRMYSDERETRRKLFGDEAVANMPAGSLTSHLSAAVGHTTTVVTDPSLVKELEALRAQLTIADQRAMEFDKSMNGMRAEKSSLEQKLKDAIAAASAGGGAAGGAANTKELEELRARLQEYEVIEDDLANLKKFQKENEQLRQKISDYEKGGAPATTVAASAPVPEAKTVVSGAPEKAQPQMTLVTGGAAPAEAPKPASSEANTNVLAPVTPSVEAAPAAAAPEKSAKQKEEELLSEFEKMLAS